MFKKEGGKSLSKWDLMFSSCKEGVYPAPFLDLKENMFMQLWSQVHLLKHTMVNTWQQ